MLSYMLRSILSCQCGVLGSNQIPTGGAIVAALTQLAHDVTHVACQGEFVSISLCVGASRPGLGADLSPLVRARKAVSPRERRAERRARAGLVLEPPGGRVTALDSPAASALARRCPQRRANWRWPSTAVGGSS